MNQQPAASHTYDDVVLSLKTIQAIRNTQAPSVVIEAERHFVEAHKQACEAIPLAEFDIAVMFAIIESIEAPDDINEAATMLMSKSLQELTVTYSRILEQWSSQQENPTASVPLRSDTSNESQHE